MAIEAQQPEAMDTARGRRRSLGGSRLTEETYKRLAVAIDQGQLAPGQQLLETALARQLGVSRTPVREALQLLAQEGLVEATPAGTFVAQLTVKEVQDAQQTSQVLLGFASRLAATRGTSEKIDQLESAIKRLESAAAGNDLERWTVADKDLHRRIMDMADNAQLARMARQMDSVISRVRHLALRQPGRLAQSTVEHRRVVEAIKTGDGEAAECEMRQHLVTVERMLTEILESFVVPFKGERF